MVTFLSSYEADNGYKKIYFKVFDDFEERLNKYRNGKGNIFDWDQFTILTMFKLSKIKDK